MCRLCTLLRVRIYYTKTVARCNTIGNKVVAISKESCNSSIAGDYSIYLYYDGSTRGVGRRSAARVGKYADA